MKISFIHISYNNSQITIDCINSILKITKDVNDTVKIIIIDNDSNSIEKEQLKSWQRKNENNNIEIYYSKSNLGYFKAINKGLELLSTEEKQSYIVIGNNDLSFDPDFLKILKTKNYNDDIFVIAPNIINKEGLHQNPHLIKRVSRIRQFYYTLYNKSYYIALFLEFLTTALKLRSSQKDKNGHEKSRYITMGFGACYILLPKFFIKNTKLDDSLFLMGEEAMLANQIISSGGRTYYDVELKVFHLDNATFKSLPSLTTYKFNQKSFKISKKVYKYTDIFDAEIESNNNS